jgi:5,10-methylenetetrahydromethanopterin reductase
MVEISCAFATTNESPQHIRVAEQLGYSRAWLYDTPQQSPDVWMMLALAAQQTSRIGLGPGVLVPSLRHPMVNATQTLTLQSMAPDRLAVAFGTGFTGRVAMGYRPLTWRYVSEYVRAYRGLLAGDTIEWEGARMRMLTPQNGQPPSTTLPPILLGAMGTRGAQTAESLGVDGIMAFGYPTAAMKDYRWSALLIAGTILDDGEEISSARVREAAGPAWAINYHYPYALGGAQAIETLPGGRAFLDVVEQTPEPDQHLAVNQGHLTSLNAADLAAWDAGGYALVQYLPATGPADKLAATIGEYARLGVTEVVYQPAGDDIPRELERFISALGGT